MKRILGLAAALIALACPALRAELNSEIRNVLQDKLLSKTTAGIEIYRLSDTPGGDQLVYKLNSDLPLTPASNLKLVTTSAALDKLGPGFNFHTLLALHDQDLVLIGDGDPTLGDFEMLKKSGWDVNTVFKIWPDELKKRGVTSVRNVVVDDSVFDQEFIHPNWPTDQLHERYVAEIGGVSLNANCLDFYVTPEGPGRLVSYRLNPNTKYAAVGNTCVGGAENAVWLSRQPGANDLVLKGTAATENVVPVSVTIHDPPLYAATVLSETLAERGIKVTGTVSRDRALGPSLRSSHNPGQDHWLQVAILETPLPKVMARANKDSMNLYAESICKRLGHAATGEPGSWQNGPAAVGQFLQHAGVNASEFKLDDGCGLSKKNAISANAIATVLRYDYHGPNRDTFLKTLAVGGVDGTFADRFRGDLRGRVLGKSGFVNGVSCVSGFLHAKDDRWYVFSILMNGIPAKSNSSIKPLQEKIIKALDTSVTMAGAN